MIFYDVTPPPGFPQKGGNQFFANIKFYQRLRPNQSGIRKWEVGSGYTARKLAVSPPRLVGEGHRKASEGPGESSVERPQRGVSCILRIYLKRAGYYSYHFSAVFATHIIWSDDLPIACGIHSVAAQCGHVK